MANVERDSGSGRRRRQRLDYHDPTAGVGGAPPAASALTLRLLIAGTALVICLAGLLIDGLRGGPVGLAVALAVVAMTTVVDLVVIVRRKRRGEPG
jgi:hypothetical protein